MTALEARRRLLMLTLDELPTGYRKVPYLYGTSYRESWLETDIKIGDNNYSVTADFRSNIRVGANSKDFFLHGGLNLTNGYYFVNPYRDNNDGQLYFYPDKVKTGIMVELDTDYRLQYFVNATNKIVTGSLNGEAFSVEIPSYQVSDANLLLFGKSKGGAWHFTGDYYRHQMTIGNEKYNLIPCVRIADSIPGFFDTVHKKFYSDSRYIYAG